MKDSLKQTGAITYQSVAMEVKDSKVVFYFIPNANCASAAVSTRTIYIPNKY